MAFGTSFFNETDYLKNNPDVAAAVKAGQFASGMDHYNAFGKNENRQSGWGGSSLASSYQPPQPAKTPVIGTPDSSANYQLPNLSAFSSSAPNNMLGNIAAGVLQMNPGATPAPQQQPPQQGWQARPGGADLITPTSDPFEDYKIAMRNGLLMQDVARRKGIGVKDAYAWLESNNLPMNHGAGFLNGVIDNLNRQGISLDDGFGALWQGARGKSLEELSLETGYSPQEIAAYMQRHGLTPAGVKDYQVGVTKLVPNAGSPILDSMNRPTGAWNGTPVFDPQGYVDHWGGQYGWTDPELAKMSAGAGKVLQGWGGSGSSTDQPSANTGGGTSTAPITASGTGITPSSYMTTPRTFGMASSSPYGSVAKRRGWGSVYLA